MTDITLLVRLYKKNVFDDAKEMKGLPRHKVLYEYMYVFIHSFTHLFIYSEVCF